MKKTQEELRAILIKQIYRDLDFIAEIINEFIRPSLNDLVEEIKESVKSGED